MISIYGDSIFESHETDIQHKNDAQQALRKGDIEGAKSAAKNIHDTAKKATIKSAIQRQQVNDKTDNDNV